MTHRRVARRTSGAASLGSAGWTMTELLVVLAVAGLVIGIGAPLTAQMKDEGRARQAAGFVSSRFRAARQQAVAEERSIGIVFDPQGAGWAFRVCADGNGNGIRRAEVLSGVDACGEGPFVFETLFPGVTIDVDLFVIGPDGETAMTDPVRFGQSDIASFSPAGSCTAGSLFVRSAQGTQYVIRVAGVTARTRVLKYHALEQTWKDA